MSRGLEMELPGNEVMLATTEEGTQTRTSASKARHVCNAHNTLLHTKLSETQLKKDYACQVCNANSYGVQPHALSTRCCEWFSQHMTQEQAVGALNSAQQPMQAKSAMRTDVVCSRTHQSTRCCEWFGQHMTQEQAADAPKSDHNARQVRNAHSPLL